MSERGDVLELLCDAFGRLPPLSATVRSWTHLDRHQEALDEARLPGGPRVSMLISPKARIESGEHENTEYLVIAPQRGAYRVEWAKTEDGSPGRLDISDGTDAWMQVAPGEVIARPPGELLRFPSDRLLDPSWLARYTWDPPVKGRSNGRDVLRMRARLKTNPNPPRRTERPDPGEVDVTVDAQLGFLHRMTELVNGQPFRDVELLEVVLDPPIDQQTFRIDESKLRVINPGRISTPPRPAPARRAWWALKSGVRHPLRRSAGKPSHT